MYIPERGDAVWITSSRQSEYEQAERCPAVVLSPVAYNQKVGLAIVCPIIDQIKGYPFEVVIPSGLAVTGAILSDQFRSMNWRVRNGLFICKLPTVTVTEALQKIKTLVSVAPT